MPDDQAAPDFSAEFHSTDVVEPEQLQTEVEEQSDEQTDEHTSEETSEESVEDQLRAQLEEANTTNANMQGQVDALNKTFTQTKQAEAEAKRQAESQAEPEDYSQFGDQGAAVQALDERTQARIDRSIEKLAKEIGAVRANQTQVTQLAAAKAKFPGVPEKDIEALVGNRDVSDYELAAMALSKGIATKVAASTSKKDQARKQNANTGTKKGGTPSNQKTGFKYNSKEHGPQGENLDSQEIMRRSLGES